MARRKRHEDAWVDDGWMPSAPTSAPAVGAQRPGVVDGSKRLKVVRRWRALVTVAVWSFVPLLAFIVILLSANLSKTPEPDPYTQYAQTRVVAVRATAGWLWANSQVVEGGQVISWDGARVLDSKPSKEGGNKSEAGVSVELHSLTVADKFSNLYLVEVPVAVAPGRGAMALSTPALVPIAPSDPELASLQAWPALDNVVVAEPLKDATTAWAKEWAGGDANRLRLVTGDQDASHTYMVMPGVSFVDVTVDQAATGPMLSTGSDQKDMAVLRARVSFTRNGKSASQDMDLLVSQATSGAPRVVAWGAAGSGPSLEPFSNAVGRKVETRTMPPGTASPSAKPGESKTPVSSPTATKS